MSDLQDALDYFDDTGDMPADVVYAKEMLTVLEAARLVADPNIEAARESVDVPAVVLLLWRIMELMGVGVAEFPERDSTGFAMMIRDSIVNKELFAAALTPPGDTDEG